MTRRLFFLLILSLPFASLDAHEGNNTYRSIEFVENRGQWDGPFVYKAVAGNTNIYLEQGGFTYVMGDPENNEKITACRHGLRHGPATLRFHAYRMRFAGATTTAVTGSKAQPHYYNYFLGKDERRWKTGIHPCLALDYKGLYPGIDLHVASENGLLKYDFIVRAGGNPAAVRLRFEGMEGLSVRNGRLYITTSVGQATEHMPYAYQFINGARKEVDCRYQVNGNEVTYTFPGGYDKGHELVIDPVVEFSTFTGSVSDNWGLSATYDGEGNFYAGGSVSGNNYPIEPATGAFQRTYAGGGPLGTPGTGGGNVGFPCDMAITKFNKTGTALLFSTFIGGSQNDQPHSMIVDQNNNLVIAGRSYSNDYPIIRPAFDTSLNGNADIVITKLNATGTALLGSTYVGGSGDDCVNVSSLWDSLFSIKHSYADDARSEVMLDRQGNIYVAAVTQSPDFPVMNAIQSTLSGGQDGVVVKLNSSLTSLIWSTYIGGSSLDAAYVLALDTSEAYLYVAGGTSSSNFPSVPGGLMAAYQGGVADGYILKFGNSGTYPLVRSTFIGRGSYDQCFGIQVDMENNVYATGNTFGGTFPVTPGVYTNPGSSQFIIKLNPDLNTNIYSTVFGSGNPNAINITPVAFLVDTCQNVYVSGWGGGQAGPGSTTIGLPITGPTDPNPAFQSTTDGNDFYFIALSKNALGLLYGTYFGANGGIGEHVDGGTSRFDRNGVVYQSICGGCGASSAAPTTPGAYSRTNNSSNCNLLAVKIAFNLGAVKAKADASPRAKGCLPFTVQFDNNSANATSFSWEFDDGSPSDTLRSPSHTFTTAGTHNVRLVAYNPDACKERDTIYLPITVDTNSMDADFSYVVTDTCDPYRAAFANNSRFSYTPGASGFTTFDWFFGDGASFTGQSPPVHSYPGPGTYTVTMVMHDSTACNDPDTVSRTFTIRHPLVRAAWNVPDSMCIADEANFSSSSDNASAVEWFFGDGGTSAETAPGHRYQQAGIYRIVLVASNPATCNKTDTLVKVIKIKPGPVASFDYDPHIPVTNMPISFTNTSVNAVSYYWDFGDLTSGTEKDPVHLYRRTDGRFRVCLTAYSLEGCTDTFCRYVDADIRPLVDVPTAFSPNGDGSNDILYVRGGAIERIQFRVYNRWGTLVFETTDINIGWDGTYKGKPQEMEAYAYTLTAVFTNGTSASKQGNITLLR